MEIKGREQKLAVFRTVRWTWMCGELVDSAEQRYEIVRRGHCLLVRLPNTTEQQLGQFFVGDTVGKRIHYIYRSLKQHQLEALDGAIVDLYPRGVARLGLPSLAIEGSSLHGSEC